MEVARLGIVAAGPPKRMLSHVSAHSVGEISRINALLLPATYTITDAHGGCCRVSAYRSDEVGVFTTVRPTSAPLIDSPDRADVSDTQLQHGDVVVFATDGVWDNLSSQDILTIVSQQMRERGAWERTDDKGIVMSGTVSSLVHPSKEQNKWTLQSAIASNIVGEAKVASMDRKRDGPFAKAVQREYPMDRWHGGKVDDITAIVFVAVENKQQEEKLKAKL